MLVDALDAVVLPDFSVRILTSVLVDEGIDPTPAMLAAHVSGGLLSDAPGTIAGTQEVAFQRAFVALTGYRPDLWIKAGLRYRLPSYGMLGMAMLTAPSVAAACQASANSWALNFTLADGLDLWQGERMLGHQLGTDPVPDDLRDFTIFRDIAASLTAMADLFRGRTPVNRVTVALPYSAGAPLEIMGQKLIYGADYTGWFWPAGINDELLHFANPVLHDAYLEALRTQIALTRASDALMEGLTRALRNLEGKQISLASVATDIGLSERTLQRRLESRGFKFRDIVDEARKRLASEMLTTTTTPVAEIAWKLGYNDISSFNHAFRRWTGASPARVRRNGAGSSHEACLVR